MMSQIRPDPTLSAHGAPWWHAPYSAWWRESTRSTNYSDDATYVSAAEVVACTLGRRLQSVAAPPIGAP